MYFIAVLFPPLAVLLCGKPVQALLNCVLTLFLWIPGIFTPAWSSASTTLTRTPPGSKTRS